MGKYLVGLLGIAVILGVAVLLSANRRAIRLRVVGAAFALQAAIAWLVLYVPAGRAVDRLAGRRASPCCSATVRRGTNFIFGGLAAPTVGGHSFAIAALPVIIFFAALVAILYHLGVMQWLVRIVGGAIQAVTGGQQGRELVRGGRHLRRPDRVAPRDPALHRRADGGATIHGDDQRDVGRGGDGPWRAYAAMGIRIDYLLAASFMSAPGGILMAKLLMPDDPDVPSADPVEVIDDAAHGEEKPANVIMAAAQGAQLGVRLAVAVAATVFAFVGLVALANGMLGGIGGWFGVNRNSPSRPCSGTSSLRSCICSTCRGRRR